MKLPKNIPFPFCLLTFLFLTLCNPNLNFCYNLWNCTYSYFLYSLLSPLYVFMGKWEFYYCTITILGCKNHFSCTYTKPNVVSGENCCRVFPTNCPPSHVICAKHPPNQPACSPIHTSMYRWWNSFKCLNYRVQKIKILPIWALLLWNWKCNSLNLRDSIHISCLFV